MNLVALLAGVAAMWVFCLVVGADVWALTEAFSWRAEHAVGRFDRGEWR